MSLRSGAGLSEHVVVQLLQASNTITLCSAIDLKFYPLTRTGNGGDGGPFAAVCFVVWKTEDTRHEPTTPSISTLDKKCANNDRDLDLLP